MIVSEMPRWGHCDGNAGREQLRITAIHWALLPFGWPLGGGNASTIAFFDWILGLAYNLRRRLIPT